MGILVTGSITQYESKLRDRQQSVSSERERLEALYAQRTSLEQMRGKNAAQNAELERLKRLTRASESRIDSLGKEVDSTQRALSALRQREGRARAASNRGLEKAQDNTPSSLGDVQFNERADQRRRLYESTGSAKYGREVYIDRIDRKERAKRPVMPSQPVGGDYVVTDSRGRSIAASEGVNTFLEGKREQESNRRVAERVVQSRMPAVYGSSGRIYLAPITPRGITARSYAKEQERIRREENPLSAFGTRMGAKSVNILRNREHIDEGKTFSLRRGYGTALGVFGVPASVGAVALGGVTDLFSGRLTITERDLRRESFFGLPAQPDKVTQRQIATAAVVGTTVAVARPLLRVPAGEGVRSPVSVREWNARTYSVRQGSSDFWSPGTTGRIPLSSEVVRPPRFVEIPTSQPRIIKIGRGLRTVQQDRALYSFVEPTKYVEQTTLTQWKPGTRIPKPIDLASLRPSRPAPIDVTPAEYLKARPAPQSNQYVYTLDDFSTPIRDVRPPAPVPRIRQSLTLSGRKGSGSLLYGDGESSFRFPAFERSRIRSPVSGSDPLRPPRTPVRSPYPVRGLFTPSLLGGSLFRNQPAVGYGTSSFINQENPLIPSSRSTPLMGFDTGISPRSSQIISQDIWFDQASASGAIALPRNLPPPSAPEPFFDEPPSSDPGKPGKNPPPFILPGIPTFGLGRGMKGRGRSTKRKYVYKPSVAGMAGFKGVSKSSQLITGFEVRR